MNRFIIRFYSLILIVSLWYSVNSETIYFSTSSSSSSSSSSYPPSSQSFLNGFSPYSTIKQKIFGNKKSTSTEESSSSSYFSPLTSIINSWNTTNKKVYNFFSTYRHYLELLYYILLCCMIKYLLPQSIQYISYLMILYIYYFGHQSFWEWIQFAILHRKLTFSLSILYTFRSFVYIILFPSYVLYWFYRFPCIEKLYINYLRNLPKQQLTFYQLEYLAAFQNPKKKSY